MILCIKHKYTKKFIQKLCETDEYRGNIIQFYAFLLPNTTKKRPRKTPGALRVDDGARTHDTRNHNPMLYQLNYIHHVRDCKGTKKIVPCKGTAEKSAKNQFDADGL